MTSFRRALTFILAQQRARTAIPVGVRKENIRVGNLAFPADVYSPTRVQRNPIVFLHGMSQLGIADPRQVIAANALAAAGFRVICPELSEIQDLKITAASIDTFTAIVGAICKDPDLCPSGQVSLFAPSFSGAICLKAAAMPQLAGRIIAICALGSMAQVRGSMVHGGTGVGGATDGGPTTMEYLFLSDEADTYARYIVLSNYLPLVKKYKPLAAVFAALARDNWNESASKNPHLKGFTPTDNVGKVLKKLTPSDRKRAIALQNDVAYRKEVFAELTPYMEKELQAYDIVSVAEKISAPTLLMHGISDNVIPPGESLRLAPHLKRVKLVISPFLGHADTKVSLKLIPDVLRMITGFAYFFRHAAR